MSLIRQPNPEYITISTNGFLHETTSLINMTKFFIKMSVELEKFYCTDNSD